MDLRHADLDGPGLDEEGLSIAKEASAPFPNGFVGQLLLGGWRYRAFDLCFVLLAAPMILTLVLAVAVMVKLDDPRAPVFFRQTRYGRGGRPFQIIKIRTMVPGAEAMKVALETQSKEKGAGFKLDDDPRITRPGRQLRKHYLDELPQFWNVLMGDMAIVGPRANSFDPAGLPHWQHLRLSVRPGITGTWQTMRDKPRDFAERCRIDIAYVRSKSFLGDLAIIWRTVAVAFVRPTGV